MADFLSSQRENFNTFGSSLAAIQQNSQDDANSNAQNADIFQQTVAQLKLEGPQALAFGGMEAIRQSTDLYDRFKAVAAKIKELPSTLTDIGARTLGNLTARGQQAKELYDTAKGKLSGTLEDVQAHATSVANQAKGVFSDATLSLKDSANLGDLKTNFANFQSDLTGRLAKANDIIDSNVKQYSDLATQAKSQIGEIQGKIEALQSSATGQLTGLAKDQLDALTAKLPDLQGQVDKANSFISSANETRQTYAKQVADQITEQGEKAKAQFSDISSRLSPAELQTQLGTVVPKVAVPDLPVVPRIVPSEILPTTSESGTSFFNRIGDYMRTKTSNTLQPASMEAEFERDPELMGAGGRGFISGVNERVTSFTTAPKMPSIAPEATSALEDLGSIGGRVLGAAGEAAGVFGGVQAGMDIARGQFNANDAANTFFGVEAGRSLGESAIGGLKSAATSLGEQLGGATDAAGNLLSAGKETGARVITSLQQSADQALTAGRSAVAATQDVISGAVKTGSEAATAAIDVGKGAVSDVAEGLGEASAAVIPIVGEVAGIGLAGYQIYEGFKDLFSHPSAPTPIAVPTVANVSQSFQSGV
jgi:hypothetical protein